jgi:hypothetical protein
LCFALLILSGLVCGVLGDIWLDLNALVPTAAQAFAPGTSAKVHDAAPSPFPNAPAQEDDSAASSGVAPPQGGPPENAPPAFMMAGFASFALGHIFYTTALIWYWRPPWEATAAALALAGLFAMAVVLAGRRRLGLDFGQLTVPAGVYGFILASMAIVAWTCCITTAGVGALPMGAGGTMFLISDLVLCFQLFRPGKAKPSGTAVCLVFYYAAQFAIALSPLALCSAS